MLSKSMIAWISHLLELLKVRIWQVMHSSVKTCLHLTILSLEHRPNTMEGCSNRIKMKKNSNTFPQKLIYLTNSLLKSRSKEQQKSTVTPRLRSSSLSCLWNWPQCHSNSHYSSKIKITQNQSQLLSEATVLMYPYMLRSLSITWMCLSTNNFTERRLSYTTAERMQWKFNCSSRKTSNLI